MSAAKTSADTYKTILYEHSDAVAVITLNRPERMNAFTGEMHRELRVALDAALEAGARAILFTGAGRGFCAGQDLTERGRPDPDNRPDARVFLHERYNPLIKYLRELRVPIIAAVNGVAAGAGMGLALAADIVLAARSASFFQAFVKIGLVPDAGSSYILPRLIGLSRARAMAMLGETITAEQAEAWGMIWKCVDDGALMDEARALAARMATMPTAALGLIKQEFNASLHNDLAAQLDLERDLQYQAGHTDDYIEGVTAFLDKRKPVFKGK